MILIHECLGYTTVNGFTHPVIVSRWVRIPQDISELIGR